jgi:hypothetical protein
MKGCENKMEEKEVVIEETLNVISDLEEVQEETLEELSDNKGEEVEENE